MPFGSDYRGGFETVQALMLHAVAFALLFPLGNILVSMGEMWLSWTINFAYAVLFALSAWWLVPRHGAAGYAASILLAYLVVNR